MSAVGLASIGPGFGDPVLDSQAVFYRFLAALAKPGMVVNLGADLHALPGLHPAAVALLLALLDQDNCLWLSPGAAGPSIATSIKFHTSCSFAASPGEADFALVAGVDELPPFESFGVGSPEYPERSATVVLQVPAIADSGWLLSGPGVRGEARLPVPALGYAFLEQWGRNVARYPRGVDLYFSCGERLCALPRTTHIAR